MTQHINEKKERQKLQWKQKKCIKRRNYHSLYVRVTNKRTDTQSTAFADSEQGVCTQKKMDKRSEYEY